MCKPILGSVKYVVFGSGFCVAKGIVELEDRSVYGGFLIKKRLSCPRNVPGNDIYKHFERKEVGSFGCLGMNSDEGKAFKTHCMKEPDHVMKMMASWMTLNDF